MVPLELDDNTPPTTLFQFLRPLDEALSPEQPNSFLTARAKASVLNNGLGFRVQGL